MKTLVTCAVTALVLSGSAHAELFGVGGFDTFSPQTLYRIDAATGAAVPVGSTGLVQIADIAFQQSTGLMFALTAAADLYTLNLTTGAATLVASSAATIPEGSLTFSPFGGGLLATNSDVLASVDLGTAALTNAGPLGVSDNDLSGLAFGPSGRLLAYAKNGGLPDTIISIDPLTGAATPVGPTGFSSSLSVGGMALDPASGGMYLSDGASLYQVNTASGAAQLIGSHGFTRFSGIAFIPSPGAGALALAAVGTLIWRRRR